MPARAAGAARQTAAVRRRTTLDPRSLQGRRGRILRRWPRAPKLGSPGLGLREAGNVEPKPGIPPGSQYLAQLVSEWPTKGVRAVIYSAYEDPRGSEFVAQRIGVPAIMLPYTVGGTERARDLFGLFDDTVERLAAGLAGAAVVKR